MSNTIIPTRALGQQGLIVSAQGLGCMGMSQSYGPADEHESIATIHRAIRYLRNQSYTILIMKWYSQVIHSEATITLLPRAILVPTV